MVYIFFVTVHTGAMLTYSKLWPFCPALLWTTSAPTSQSASEIECSKRQTLSYSDYVNISSAFILSGCLSGL